MKMLDRLKARYEQYECDAQKAAEKAKPTDGLFGMGMDPRRHPCHEQFYEDVGEWMKEFLAGAPSAQDAAEAAEWILKAADSRRDTAAYWYLYAAQGHALPLIERMSVERCAELARWYDSAYPALDRMPVQRSVFKLLRKCSKAKK